MAALTTTVGTPTTGLNEAFIIDTPTRNRLVQQDPRSAEVIKPILRGEDLRPWYQEDEGRWVIFTRRGIDIDHYPVVKQHLELFRAQLEPRPADWDVTQPWPGRKQGSYRWYEIQDSVDYYEAFEQPKIFWPDIAKSPRFSWDTSVKYVNDKGYIALLPDEFALGVLQSRALWFCIARMCVPLGERAGIERYQLKSQFISKLPIPDAPEESRKAIAEIAREITRLARERYGLHERVRRRISSDLGSGRSLNQKLTAWWERDFTEFRTEVAKHLKHDIALRDRDEWEEWLTAQRERHDRLTAGIVEREAQLNSLVYTLFGLSADEITLIEHTTRYTYGAV